jgi:chemotaxis regulatin CheY-phosphate phosphatase CheZ
MQTLSEDEIDKLWSRRKQYLINMPELAVMLNCQHTDIVLAQMGKPVPDEVYSAITTWLGVFDLTKCK